MKMKVLIAVICSLLIASSSAFPRVSDGKIPEQVDIIPVDKPHSSRQPIVDIDAGIGGSNNYFDNPFDGLFSSFDSIMESIRQQMNQLLGRLPSGFNATDDVDFPGIRFPSIPFPDLDLGKGNSSSVTKIIDGHKVVINETEYKKEGQNGGAIVKIRVIDVKPEKDESSGEPDSSASTNPPANKDRETVEDSQENEITKHRENEVGNAEPEKLRAA